jgi:hypothetical protein
MDVAGDEAIGGFKLRQAAENEVFAILAMRSTSVSRIVWPGLAGKGRSSTASPAISPSRLPAGGLSFRNTVHELRQQWTTVRCERRNPFRC